MTTSTRLSRRQRLDPLLPMVDETMRTRPWSPQHVASLASFRAERAGRWRTSLDHVVDVHWSTWNFLEDSPWRSSWDALGYVRDEEPTSRRQLMGVAVDCRERDDWIPLLLASFAWGMGSTGYGPARLKTVLQWGNSNPRRVDDLNHILSAAVHKLRNDPVHAYAFLRGQEQAQYGTAEGAGRVPGWGPAFFTKFLYFASGALLPQGRPALILDMRVAQTLRRLTRETLEAEDVAALRDPQDVVTSDEVAKWAWADGGWWTGRYKAYLDYVRTKQHELEESLPGWPHDPAILEIALWQRYPNTAVRKSDHVP